MRLTKEQHDARREGLGSSEIAEVIGISPYAGAGALRLFAEKSGLLPRDEEDESKETEQQELGHLLEQVLAELYCKRTGNTFLPGGTVQHREHAWAFASLDGKIIGKPAGLEVKVVGVGMVRDWDPLLDDGVPHYVRTQNAWAMACADLEEMHTIALLGGTLARVFIVKRDTELEAMLLTRGELFWSRVKAGVAPELDASDATRTYLEAKYPAPPKPVEIEHDQEIEELGVAVVLGKSQAKDKTKEASFLSAKIMERMGEKGASVFKGDRVRVTWSLPRRAGGKRTFTVKPIGPTWAPGVADAADGEAPF